MAERELTADAGKRFSSRVTLESLRATMHAFAAERDWNQFHTPRNLLLALTGELGELAELFQWRGEVRPGCPGWTADEKEHLGQELSDVLLYTVRLADRCGVDLADAVLKKMQLNAKKYPADLVRGSSKKYSEYKAAAREKAARKAAKRAKKDGESKDEGAAATVEAVTEVELYVTASSGGGGSKRARKRAGKGKKAHKRDGSGKTAGDAAEEEKMKPEVKSDAGKAVAAGEDSKATRYSLAEMFMLIVGALASLFVLACIAYAAGLTVLF
eukprot:PLAT6426.1.p1 GENE.PLAT6426.1~~PLAT6426.1.p1  ORF type:complete len:271 (+),score=77.90 PLAT6426.1:197-1009(+)